MYLKARKDGRLGSNTIMLIHVVYLIKSFPLGVLKKRVKKISLLSSSRKKNKKFNSRNLRKFFLRFFRLTKLSLDNTSYFKGRSLS